MSLHWDENLCLGISEIDDQHREIFARFEKLAAACQEGHGSSTVQELLDFLAEYTRNHFSNEETLMARHSYPGLPEQQEQHAGFLQDITALQKRVAQEGTTKEVALTINGTLVRWLIQHIRNTDKEMIDYVKPLLLP